MKKLLLILLPVLAFVGGAISGDILGEPKPADETRTQGTATEQADAASQTGKGESSSTTKDDTLGWFRFPTQIFVPVLRNGSPTAVMILSLGIETPASAQAEIEAQELRLRDSLLNALMIEANTGAFDGNFTSEVTLQKLRTSLLAAAQKTAGPNVRRILIEDIGRQEQ